MKKIFLLILLCVIGMNTHAQMSLKMGDFKYKITNYRGAAKSYKRYLNDNENQYNVEVIRKLANAYLKSNQTALAEQSFAKLTILDSSFADALAYSEILLKNEKYDTLEKFIKTNPSLKAKNDSRVNNILKSIQYVDQLQTLDTGNIQITKLAFNNVNSDFAPSFFQNGIVFSSNRISNGFFKSKKTKSNKKIVGLYFSNGEDGFNKVTKIAGTLKQKGNYGHASYHTKSRTLYYVVNANPKKENSTEKDIQIYASKYDFNKNTWLKSVPFVHNSTAYSSTTPFVNQEGTRLYFSSNKKGGFGGFDLYVCEWKDSTWSAPVNMGPKINSAGNELYPYVDNTNLFYFSSDGRGGLGELDIFTFDLNHENAVADNLGAPFNSNADDFGMLKYSKLEKGFFSSSRAGNGTNADIYSYTRLKPTTKNSTIRLVDANTNAPVTNAELYLVTEKEIIKYMLSNASKTIENTEPGKTLNFVVVAQGYDSAKSNILINRVDTLYEIRLNRLVEGCSLAGVVINKTTGERLKGVRVTAQNAIDPKDRFEAITDDKGMYSIRGLKKSSSYTISVEQEGYFASAKNVKTLSTCIPLNNSFDYQQDFKLISGSLVKIDKIYFDFNKYNIRPDAALELNKIVSFMKENPEVLVELYSHTDARGTDQVNLSISQRRARASVNYITSKGISRKRISGIGYGETRLLNNCTNDVTCTEEEHQVNRRTEMQVVGVKGE